MRPTRNALAVVLLASACAGTPHVPPPPSYVDLSHYVGTWYEIARLPARFQSDCVASRAEYTLLSSGKIGVTNTCRMRDGRERTVRGEAEVLDRTTNARLLVRFDTWLAFFMPAPSAGNYWILDVAADYQSAMVASPDRSHLWLLARSPEDGVERYPGMVARAREMGFPVERLVRDQWSAKEPAPAASHE
jgi:apolipoprotein D and lipocalin family protein